jgi:hypothetical protein
VSIAIRSCVSKNIKLTRTPINTLLIIFFIGSLLSGFYGLSVGNDKRLILAEFFPIIELEFFFFITLIVVKTRRQLIRIFSLMWVWIVINVISDIILFTTTSGRYGVRIPIIGLEVNRIPCYMVPMFLMVFATVFLYAKNRKLRILLAGSIALSLIDISLSFWRSLYVGVIFGLVFVACKMKGFKLKSKWVAGLLLAFLLIFSLGNYLSARNPESFKGATFSQLVINRFVDIFRPEEAVHFSKSARAEHNKQIPYRIAERPLVGLGLGGSLIMSNGVKVWLINTSNYYLNIAASMGLPALVLFMFTLLMFYKKSIMIYDSLILGLDKGLALGLLAGCMSMAVVFLTFPCLIHFPVMAYLGVYMAMVFNLSEIVKREAHLEH